MNKLLLVMCLVLATVQPAFSQSSELPKTVIKYRQQVLERFRLDVVRLMMADYFVAQSMEINDIQAYSDAVDQKALGLYAEGVNKILEGLDTVIASVGGPKDVTKEQAEVLLKEVDLTVEKILEQ